MSIKLGINVLGLQERLTEENAHLSADLNILKQKCAELEVDQGNMLRMKELAEKALQNESKRLATFSVEVRAALEAAAAISDANPKVLDCCSP